MFLKQYYLGCLSHASYLIGDESTGKAVVVDPQRDVDEYLADAEAHGFTDGPVGHESVVRVKVGFKTVFHFLRTKCCYDICLLSSLI